MGTREDETIHQAEANRAEIAARDPQLLVLLDECKRVFGARVLAIDCGSVKKGDPRSPRYVGIPCSPPVRTPAEHLADWKREVEAQQARAGAHKGPAHKRAARSR